MKKLLKGLLRYGSAAIGIFFLIKVSQTAAGKFLFEGFIQLSYWQMAFTLIVIVLLFRFKRIFRLTTKAYSLAVRFLDLLGVGVSRPPSLKIPTPIKKRRFAWIPFIKPLQPHWRDYEIAAVSFLQRLGFTRAQGAAPGADGGVDVRVPGVLVGQVKAHTSKIGSPQLQQIFGVATGEGGVKALFFSKSGYSKNGIDWANQNGLILFQITYREEAFVVTPINSAGRNFISSNGRRS
jgi:hypothetical protein